MSQALVQSSGCQGLKSPKSEFMVQARKQAQRTEGTCPRLAERESTWNARLPMPSLVPSMPSSVPSTLHTLSRQVLCQQWKCPYPSWTLSMVAGCLVRQRDQ